MKTAKGYKPGDTNRNAFLATHGNVSGAAAHFFDDCLWAAELVQMSAKAGTPKIEIRGYNRPLMKSLEVSEQQVRTECDRLGMDVLKLVVWAVANKDGSFFEDVAKLCKRGPAFDALRSWLIVTHFPASEGRLIRGGKQKKMTLSVKELAYNARQANVSGVENMKAAALEKQIRRACRELGIKTVEWKQPKS